MFVDALILLVEDETLILVLLEAMVEDAGFRVVAVVSGAQALAELEANPARFGAPLTDVRLGQPDGWEVARWARELVPRMPVLYVTGDSAHEWHTQGVPNSLVVAKPFVAAQIVTALRALLIEADSR